MKRASCALNSSTCNEDGPVSAMVEDPEPWLGWNDLKSPNFAPNEGGSRWSSRIHGLSTTFFALVFARTMSFRLRRILDDSDSDGENKLSKANEAGMSNKSLPTAEVQEKIAIPAKPASATTRLRRVAVSDDEDDVGI
jgi:hypothetical protein